MQQEPEQYRWYCDGQKEEQILQHFLHENLLFSEKRLPKKGVPEGSLPLPSLPHRRNIWAYAMTLRDPHSEHFR